MPCRLVSSFTQLSKRLLSPHPNKVPLAFDVIGHFLNVQKFILEVAKRY